MLFHEFQITRSTHITNKDIQHMLSDLVKKHITKLIKIAFNKDPISGWKNIDPKSVSPENLRILILPILQDLNADKWTLNFVGPLNKKIQDSIDILIYT